MLRTLDREFFKIWLLPTISSLLVFLVLFLVGDLLGSTDKFIENWPGLFFLLEYYLFRISYILYFFIPMAVLLGGFWGLCGWRDSSEWTAALTGGQHPFLLLRLPMASLLILTLITIYFSLYILPHVANKAIFMRDTQIRGRTVETMDYTDLHLRLVDGRSIRIDRFHPEDKVLRGVVITDRTGPQVLQRWEAPRAVYAPHEGWQMQDVTRRIFAADGEHRVEKIDSELLALQPPSFLQSILETDPRHSDKRPEQFFTGELLRAISFRNQREMNAGAERVYLHWKISFPLSIIIFGISGLLLGIKSDLTRAAGIGFCLVFSFSYWIVFNSFIALGKSAHFTFFPENIAALFAAYLPVVIYSGFILYLLPGSGRIKLKKSLIRLYTLIHP